MIKFKNVEMTYHFGESKSTQKKTVVCELTADLSINHAGNDYTDNAVSYLLDSILKKDLKENKFGYFDTQYKFIGKAVLAEGDEYDEELGKKIAESKAKKKLFAKELKLNAEFIKTLQKLYAQTDEFFIKRVNTFEQEAAHYEALTGKAEEIMEE